MHAWEARTSAFADPDAAEACLSLLSPAERERDDRFLFDRDGPPSTFDRLRDALDRRDTEAS